MFSNVNTNNMHTYYCISGWIAGQRSTSTKCQNPVWNCSMTCPFLRQKWRWFGRILHVSFWTRYIITRSCLKKIQIRLSKCMVIIYAYYICFSNKGAMILLVLYYVPWHTIVQIQNEIQGVGSCCQVSSNHLQRLTAVAHHSGQQESWRKPWMGTFWWHSCSAGATVFSDYWDFVRNLIRFILSKFLDEQWNSLIHDIWYMPLLLYDIICVLSQLYYWSGSDSKWGAKRGDLFLIYVWQKRDPGYVPYNNNFYYIIHDQFGSGGKLPSMWLAGCA